MPAQTIYKGQMTYARPIADTLQDLGSLGTGTSTLDVTLGGYVKIATTGATRTIAVGTGGVITGQRLTVDVSCSATALTLTWTGFVGASTAVGSNKRHVFNFIYDGTNWVCTSEKADF